MDSIVSRSLQLSVLIASSSLCILGWNEYNLHQAARRLDIAGATNTRRIALAPIVYNSPDEAKVNCSIEIVNDTDQEIVFTDVNKSCACTAVELNDKTLPVGSRTSMDVTINMAGESGGVRTVGISLHRSQGAPYVYTIAVPIFPSITFEKSSVILGELAPNAIKSRRLQLYAYSLPGTQPAEIQEFQSDSENVAARILSVKDEDVSGVCRRAYTVEILVSAPPEPSNYLARVKPTTVHDERPEGGLDIAWSVKSSFVLTPPRLLIKASLDSAKSVRETSNAVAITRTDGLPFKIERVSTSNELIQCRLDSKEAAVQHFIDVTVAADGASPTNTILADVSLLDGSGKAIAKFPVAVSPPIASTKAADASREGGRL